METKLIKNELPYGFFLYDEKGDLIASTIKGYKKQPLSLKNCEAIANGYDLDELAESLYLKSGGISDILSFKIGFQKALEILGNKKFSEKKMLEFGEYVWKHGGREKSMNQLLNDYKAPKQTEWDVIVEMESIPADRAPNGWDIFPKFDVDGCLILKRK